MKWIAISGSWRKTNLEIEKKVRKIVSLNIKKGNGIVSGGALGVDYLVLDEALKHDLKAEKIKIFLPTTLEKYKKHLKKHAKLKNIIPNQAEKLINQLLNLKKINPKALVEDLSVHFNEENKKTKYYQRNSKIIKKADKLIAFRIKTRLSKGSGVADAVKKAKLKKIPINYYYYDLS